MKRSIMKLNSLILLIACLTAMNSCKDDVFNRQAIDMSEANEIILSGSYGNMTRASETGFANNDAMGIYIVDYKNDASMPLEEDNLHAKNVKFTYSDEENRWYSPSPIYWNDNSTPVDIYGYYPFDQSMSSPKQYQMKVSTRQNEEASSGNISAYEQSDFLWAKASGVKPTSETILLEYKHALAGVTIRLEPGSGFVPSEFSALDKIVWIDNTIADAYIDIENQTSTVGTGDCERIYPRPYNSEYRGIVVPQTIAAGKCIIGMTIDGKNYQLTKTENLTYMQGKMHTFTITINKKTDTGDYEIILLPESITAWVDDPNFHDGIIYQYMIVEVEEAGTLKSKIASMGLMASEISALKVKGPLNEDDRRFIGEEMTDCEALNLADAIMTDDQLSIWTYHWTLDSHVHHIVYPTTPFKKLGSVGGFVRGNQIIPEGVEEIDGWVAAEGTQVSFPTTLKRIGDIGSNLRGELKFPEYLESYGNISGFFTGSLYLPESLKELGSIEGKFTGGLSIPQGIKQIPNSAFNGCTFTGMLDLPVGLEKVGDRSLESCGFSGELVLPESVKEIGQTAFVSNKFTNIVWSSNLSIIGNYAFENCNRIQGTLTIPKKISAINEGVFKGASLLTALELHEDIEYIGAYAFSGCERFTTITCMAETPPLVHSTAFQGVGLDHVILEVPAASLSLYKTAPVWKEFKHITAYKDFSCYPAQIQALNNPKTHTVTISAKSDWKLKDCPDWCSVNKKEGSGKSQVSISVAELAAGSPTRQGVVTFELADGTASISLDVAQYDYRYGEDSAITLKQHTIGTGIPIYFVGDGWTGSDIVSDKFLNQCVEDMNYFFGVAPYDRMADYFDVYALVSLSQETGINTVYTYRDTKFSTIYSAATQLIPDESKILNYLKQEVTGTSINDHDLNKGLIILIPNVEDYGSATYYYEGGVTISICSPTTNPYPMDNRGVVQHEACGHGFGKLGDELIGKNQFAPLGVTGQIQSMHDIGWFMNLSSTGNMQSVPWSHLIFDPRYSDRVDIFEGGLGYTRGVYRSEANSCMNLGIPYFSSISRQDITKRILETAGMGWDIESFFANDTFDWGNTQTRSSDYDNLTEIPEHKAPTFLTHAQSKALLNKIRSQQKSNTKQLK